MRKVIVTLAVVLVSASTIGQGTIYFTTRIAGSVDAPVFGPDGVTGLGAYGGSAQLFLFSNGAVGAALFPATTFRTSPLGAAQNYVVPPATPVIVPGIPGGQQATIVLRAWLGNSYESGYGGQSPPITITLGSDIPGQPPALPAILVGLQGFCCVPEPSTTTLGLLGAAALLCRRRN